MSFDIFISCMQDTTFKRTLAEEILGRAAIDPVFPLMSVIYKDGGAQIYGAEDKEDLEGMMFNHCGGGTFFAALYELADRTGCMIFWPSVGRQLAVTSPAMLDQLPEGTEVLGEPYVVSNGQELADSIAHSDDL